MKRIFTLLVAMVAIVTTASAQFQFGVEAGLNINKPSSFDNESLKAMVTPKNSLGWFAGIKVKKQFVSGFGFDGALLFSQMKDDLGEASKSLQYLTVPLNARFQIGLGSLASIYLAAGPQWSVNIGDRDWDWGDISQAKSLGEEYYESATKQHNISANLGAGVILMKHLQVGFTYNIPITANGEMLYNKPTVDNFGQTTYEEYKENWRNNTWQIRAAYFF